MIGGESGRCKDVVGQSWASDSFTTGSQVTPDVFPGEETELRLSSELLHK